MACRGQLFATANRRRPKTGLSSRRLEGRRRKGNVAGHATGRKACEGRCTLELAVTPRETSRLSEGGEAALQPLRDPPDHHVELGGGWPEAAEHEARIVEPCRLRL